VFWKKGWGDLDVFLFCINKTMGYGVVLEDESNAID